MRDATAHIGGGEPETLPPARTVSAALYALLGPSALILVLLGAGLQGYAHGTLDAVYTAFLFLGLGYLTVALFSRGHAAALRVFALSYGFCVLAGGLAQCYALWAFGQLLSTTDAQNFFGALLEKPPYYDWHTLQFTWLVGTPVGRGTPLAVLTWQYVCRSLMALGMDFGPYMPILFNAMIVGLTGSLTVAVARILYGDDQYRLRRVVVLYALCGMCWLFGAILLRDAMTLLLNTLTLYVLVRVIQYPSARNLLLAAVTTIVAGYLMWYLRPQSTYLFVFFCLLAFACWYTLGAPSTFKTLATLAIPLLFGVGSVFLIQYFGETIATVQEESEEYEELATDLSREDSLGMALVIRQPQPVRAILGSGVVMAFPIPLWAYIAPGASEYNLLKTWQGFYKLLMIPLFLTGAGALLYRIFFRRERLAGFSFVALYAVLMLVAVGATSLETRHIGQFMPAFIVLAGLPDLRDTGGRAAVFTVTTLWYGVLIGVHLAWAAMRFT